MIDGDTLSINSTGTVRNDGTLSANKGAFLSADTLINDGKINGGAFTGITTRGDTVNRGRIEGNAIAIDAGGSVINTVRFDGMNATGGVIQAGTGGLQIDAKLDVVNQGQMSSAGAAVVHADRDFIQNAATTSATAGVVTGPASSLTVGTSAIVTTGRDMVLDQSSVTAGQHLIMDAGRDGVFNASTVEAGGDLAVHTGGDLLSTANTNTASVTSIDKQGKTTTTTTVTDQTVNGSTFHSGANMVLESEGSMVLQSADLDSGGSAHLKKHQASCEERRRAGFA